VQKGVKRKADTTTSFDEEGHVGGSKTVPEKKGRFLFLCKMFN
jgi:hypothetical protein